MPSTTKAPAKKPTVPETKLKKAKVTAARGLGRKASLIKSKKASRALAAVAFHRGEKHANDYAKWKRAYLANKRVATTNGQHFVPDEPRVALVIRIRGVNQVHPRVRKVLKLFRLLQINNATFVKLNKATLQMLRIVEPMVTWGYPSMKTIHDLVYKRGFGKVQGRRTAINCNEIVKQQLGKHDIVCVQDVINEIHKCGPKFKQVNNFLWPFKLTNPRQGGWRKKKTHFIEGGDFGNREDQINALIARMN